MEGEAGTRSGLEPMSANLFRCGLRCPYWTSSAPVISSVMSPGNASATAKKANVTIASMTNLP